MRATLLSLMISIALGGSLSPASAAPPASVSKGARLMGIVLASGQALVWNGRRQRYVLLRRGDRFEGARILGLGSDRLLAERGGVKFIWKLGAPLLVHPGRPAGGLRRPGLIITPEAPPPARIPARRVGPRGLPPAPLARDEPRKVERRRASLSLAVLAGLAADFRAAGAQISFHRLEGRRLQVKTLAPRSALSPLGLAKGDVILRINGRAVDSAAAAAEVFAELRRGGILKIELARGHRLIELLVRLR